MPRVYGCCSHPCPIPKPPPASWSACAQNHPPAFDRIASSPAALRSAIHLFSYSTFLSEAALKNPERILDVAQSGSFYRVLTAEEYAALLESIVPLTDLARFRRRQLIRDRPSRCARRSHARRDHQELSNLADAILDVAYRRVRGAFVDTPRRAAPADGSLCGFSVISLGKLGGEELNYSSDIDLMFVYGGNGETDGPSPVTNKEFYKKVANEYTALLSAYTGEGQCYRVDLRLRPDGTLGEICISEEGARAYYTDRARDWEKQMLIKARVSAGDPRAGRRPAGVRRAPDLPELPRFPRRRSGLRNAAAHQRENGRATRRAMAGSTSSLRPAASAISNSWCSACSGCTADASRGFGTAAPCSPLSACATRDFSPQASMRDLGAAYQFLRYLEHRLQMEEDRQTHTLPSDPAQLDLLARKMPPDSTGVALTGADPAPEAGRASRRRQGNLRARDPRTAAAVLHSPGAVRSGEAEPASEPPPSSNVARLLDQRAPQLADAVAKAGPQRGRQRFEHFLEKAVASPELLARLERDPKLAEAVFDIFEHSN